MRILSILTNVCEYNDSAKILSFHESGKIERKGKKNNNDKNKIQRVEVD